ncbi:MAG TPA: serine hydrolase domain-containing protein [Pyrinomonadaceae bacterium]|nr:serine hydrolase domain-containing protein [Pyrinomonadaceae bacterium]
MYLKRPPFFALVLLLALSVAAQADKVDDYVKAQMEKQHIPGVSLLVIKDDKIIKSQGYGLANVELNVPATADTVYKIGSVSKQFLATGIMLLVQDGKISLDDPVAKFLEGTPDTWKPITVRHLLTHTSGIVREAPGFDPLKIQNEADVIKTAYPLPLRFTPGEKYEYCNVGYFTLAEIISKVSGKPWGDFLKERVFEPLGMNSTRTTNMTELVPNRANGYVWRNGKLQNASIYFALRPSGAFLSTINDLAKWDAALNTGKILKPSTLEQMWTPVKLNNGTTSLYGFGWELTPIRDHKQVNHGGSLPGFRAQYTRFVDDKISIAVLTNGDNANASAIAIGVANFYIPGLIPERVVAKVDPKIFDNYAGQYEGNPSQIMSVTREADKLMIQQGTGEKRELSPESETVFFIKDLPRSTYSFIKDASGQAFLVVHQDGREVWRGKKIK